MKKHSKTSRTLSSSQLNIQNTKNFGETIRFKAFVLKLKRMVGFPRDVYCDDDVLSSDYLDSLFQHLCKLNDEFTVTKDELKDSKELINSIRESVASIYDYNVSSSPNANIPKPPETVKSENVKKENVSVLDSPSTLIIGENGESPQDDEMTSPKNTATSIGAADSPNLIENLSSTLAKTSFSDPLSINETPVPVESPPTRRRRPVTSANHQIKVSSDKLPVMNDKLSDSKGGRMNTRGKVGTKKFKCFVCEKLFPNAGAWNNHLKLKHEIYEASNHVLMEMACTDEIIEENLRNAQCPIND